MKRNECIHSRYHWIYRYLFFYVESKCSNQSEHSITNEKTKEKAKSYVVVILLYLFLLKHMFRWILCELMENCCFVLCFFFLLTLVFNFFLWIIQNTEFCFVSFIETLHMYVCVVCSRHNFFIHTNKIFKVFVGILFRFSFAIRVFFLSLFIVFIGLFTSTYKVIWQVNSNNALVCWFSSLSFSLVTTNFLSFSFIAVLLSRKSKAICYYLK